jgi:hypothetical protein
MNKKLSDNNKLSITASQFLHPLENYLQKEPLVLWHQLAWTGGQQDWFFVTTSTGLQKVLSTGQRASAFTAYQWLPHAHHYVVNELWVTQMLEVIKKNIPNHFILVMPVSAEQTMTDFYLLKWLCDEEDLQDYLAEHQGKQVIVGQTPNIQTGEIKRGYMPNQDGIPESGPY